MSASANRPTVPPAKWAAGAVHGECVKALDAALRQQGVFLGPEALHYVARKATKPVWIGPVSDLRDALNKARGLPPATLTGATLP